MHAAKTLTVTTLADNGSGSLRGAINQANLDVGDTITFASNVTGTITLTSGELVIGRDLTIAGPGASQLTISGNNTSRIFFVNPGAPGVTSGPPSTKPNVMISGLTLTAGVAQGGAGDSASDRRGGGSGSGGSAGLGGALLVNGGGVTLSSVMLSGNQARGGDGSGGPIAFFGAARAAQVWGVRALATQVEGRAVAAATWAASAGRAAATTVARRRELRAVPVAPVAMALAAVAVASTRTAPPTASAAAPTMRASAAQAETAASAVAAAAAG